MLLAWPCYLDEFPLRHFVKQEGVAPADIHGSIANVCKQAGIGAIPESTQDLSLSPLPLHRYGKVRFCRKLTDKPH